MNYYLLAYFCIDIDIPAKHHIDLWITQWKKSPYGAIYCAVTAIAWSWYGFHIAEIHRLVLAGRRAKRIHHVNIGLIEISVDSHCPFGKQVLRQAVSNSVTF